MTSFGARSCVLVLALGMTSGVWAKDLSEPPRECGFLCTLQTYVATDHMVATAPAPEAPPADAPAARKPKTVTLRAPVKQQAATRKPTLAAPSVPAAPPVPRPAGSDRTRLARHARPLRTAATPEVSPRPLPAPAATARRDGTLIPGSAPMMAAQFEPATIR